MIKYLSEISHYPLLNKEEEYKISKLISTGDEIAKEKLIMSNLRLVVSIAKRYHPLWITYSGSCPRRYHRLDKVC